jgi:hypothetical protein
MQIVLDAKRKKELLNKYIYIISINEWNTNFTYVLLY